MVSINDERYGHQLYFFTKEAQEVRTYFSGLLFLNNKKINDHQIKHPFNYDELAQKISVLTKKSDSYKLINQMIRTENALKIIIALLFKGFSWTNELTNHFNISKKIYVINTLWSLQTFNLIVKEKGDKLNPYYWEALHKSKSSQIRKVLHQADIYYITEDFVKFCSLLKELFEYKIQESETFRFSLSEIIADAKRFQVYYDKIMEEESSLLQRCHRTEESLIYYTDTIKSKHLQDQVKEVVAEIKFEQLESKEQQLLLTESEKHQLDIVRTSSNPLMLLDNKKDPLLNFKKTKRVTSTYNGRECNIDEILESAKKLDEEIEKAPIEKGRKDLSTDPEIQKEGERLARAIMKTLRREEKKTPEDEINNLFSSFYGGKQKAIMEAEEE